MEVMRMNPKPMRIRRQLSRRNSRTFSIKSSALNFGSMPTNLNTAWQDKFFDLHAMALGVSSLWSKLRKSWESGMSCMRKGRLGGQYGKGRKRRDIKVQDPSRLKKDMEIQSLKRIKRDVKV